MSFYVRGQECDWSKTILLVELRVEARLLHPWRTYSPGHIPPQQAKVLVSLKPPSCSLGTVQMCDSLDLQGSPLSLLLSPSPLLSSRKGKQGKLWATNGCWTVIPQKFKIPHLVSYNCDPWASEHSRIPWSSETQKVVTKRCLQWDFFHGFTLLPFTTSLSAARGLLIVCSRYHNTPYPWPTTILLIFSSNTRREIHILTNITWSPWIQTRNLSLLGQWWFCYMSHLTIFTWPSPNQRFKKAWALNYSPTQLFPNTVLSALLKTIVLKRCLIVKQVMSVHTQ